jgi:hypothetical protein
MEQAGSIWIIDLKTGKKSAKPFLKIEEKGGGKRPKDNVEPVYVYKHGSGQREGLSVTGGFVYRCSKAATFLQTTRTPGSGRS